MIKFHEFEKVNGLLEKYTIDEIKGNPGLLTEAELDSSIMPEIEKINEGFLGGLFDKLKNALSKSIPGGILNRAEKQLKAYKENLEDALEQEFKLRKDVLGEEADDKERRDEFNKQMSKVNSKLEEFKENSETEFFKMTKGQPDRVRDYINMRLAGIKAEISKTELDYAQKNAKLFTKKEQDRIKTEEADAAKSAKEQATALEKVAAEKKEDKKEEPKDNKDQKKPEETINDKYAKDQKETINDKYAKENNIKVGDTYNRVDNSGEKQKVEVVDIGSKDGKVKEGNVQVKNIKNGHKFVVPIKSLGDKVDIEEPKDKKGGVLKKLSGELAKKYEPVKKAA